MIDFLADFDTIISTRTMMVKAHGNCRLFCPAVFESFGYFCVWNEEQLWTLEVRYRTRFLGLGQLL